MEKLWLNEYKERQQKSREKERERIREREREKQRDNFSLCIYVPLDISLASRFLHWHMSCIQKQCTTIFLILFSSNIKKEKKQDSAMLLIALIYICDSTNYSDYLSA